MRLLTVKKNTETTRKHLHKEDKVQITENCHDDT